MATLITNPVATEAFRIDIPRADRADLSRRLAATRWPDAWSEGWERGVPVDYLRRLASYWANDYDWTVHESRLNRCPQFRTEVDGQLIHFLHVRSAREDARPLLLLHGYPGTFVDFERVIRPLTQPDAGENAYHLVIPSLPGFGFSTPLSGAGWEVGRTARACAELMRRLGYGRYFCHGFDVGAGVASELGPIDGDHVVAIHVSTDPWALPLLGLPIPDLPDDKDGEVERLRDYATEGTGYLKLQSTRPQTLAYALTDSPVGQLAWIVEKYREWTSREADLPEAAVDIDQLLTSISIYWFTRSGASAAQFIYEAAHATPNWGAQSTTPVGFAVFGTHPIVRRALDPDGKIEHWSEFKQGGHFPAMEVPDILVGDLRAYFARFRP